MMADMAFLTNEQALALRETFGSPIYVYDQRTLEKQAQEVLRFPHAFGLTARFAMKALPTAAILRVFTDAGLHIDASSGYEVERTVRAGVSPQRIQLTAQELPADLKQWLDMGVLFNACSLYQLETFGKLAPGSELSVRINPGLGSGHCNRTNVGGPSAGFGIWYEHLDDVFRIQREYGLRITRMHTHIGSGADPEVWHRCAQLSLDVVERLPDVHTLNLGGGFKVARMSDETSAELQAIGRRVKDDFVAFYERSGRKLRLEIEPGAYLVANAGVIVCTVIDVVDTGPNGFRFIKTDTGMTEILRPSLYGAQHPIALVPHDATPRPMRQYLVVGHCCESGDLLTPEPGNPERLLPRTLPEARIDDALVIGGAGAYCSAMSAKNYNSFPEAAEVLLDRQGNPCLIRRRQTLQQMIANEVCPGQSSSASG